MVLSTSDFRELEELREVVERQRRRIKELLEAEPGQRQDTEEEQQMEAIHDKLIATLKEVGRNKWMKERFSLQFVGSHHTERWEIQDSWTGKVHQVFEKYEREAAKGVCEVLELAHQLCNAKVKITTKVCIHLGGEE